MSTLASGTTNAVVSALLLLILLVSTASGAVVTWTGGAATSSWANPANWDSDSTPAAGDDVVINSGVTLVTITSAPVEVNSITSQSPMLLDGTTLQVHALSSFSSLVLDDCTMTLDAATSVSVDDLKTRGGAVDILGGGTISVTSSLDVESTTTSIIGSGGAVTELNIGNAATATISTLNHLTFNNIKIVNHGSLIINGATPQQYFFYFYGTGQLINEAGALVEFNNVVKFYVVGVDVTFSDVLINRGTWNHMPSSITYYTVESATTSPIMVNEGLFTVPDVGLVSVAVPFTSSPSSVIHFDSETARLEVAEKLSFSGSFSTQGSPFDAGRIHVESSGFLNVSAVPTPIVRHLSMGSVSAYIGGVLGVFDFEVSGGRIAGGSYVSLYNSFTSTLSTFTVGQSSSPTATLHLLSTATGNALLSNLNTYNAQLLIDGELSLNTSSTSTRNILVYEDFEAIVSSTGSLTTYGRIQFYGQTNGASRSFAIEGSLNLEPNVLYPTEEYVAFTTRSFDISVSGSLTSNVELRIESDSTLDVASTATLQWPSADSVLQLEATVSMDAGASYNVPGDASLHLPRVILSSGSSLGVGITEPLRINHLESYGGNLAANNTVIGTLEIKASSPALFSLRSVVNVTNAFTFNHGTIGTSDNIQKDDRPQLNLLESSTSYMDPNIYTNLFISNVDFNTYGTFYAHYRQLSSYRTYLSYTTSWTNYGSVVLGAYFSIGTQSPRNGGVSFVNHGSVTYNSTIQGLHATSTYAIDFYGGCSSVCSSPEVFVNYGVVDFTDAPVVHIQRSFYFESHPGSTLSLSTSVYTSTLWHIFDGAVLNLNTSPEARIYVRGHFNISDGVQVNSITGGEFDFPRVSLESGTGLEYRPSSHSVRVRAVDCLGSTFHGSNTIVTDYLYVGSSAECVSGASMNVTTRMHMWSGTLGKVGTSSEDRPVITLLEGSNSTLDALPFNQLYFDNIDFVSRGTLYWHYRHIGAYHVYLRYHTTWTNYGELIVGGSVSLRSDAPTSEVTFTNFGSMRYDSDMVEVHASNDRRVWFYGDCTTSCSAPEVINNYGVMDFSEAAYFSQQNSMQVHIHSGSSLSLPVTVYPGRTFNVYNGAVLNLNTSPEARIYVRGHFNISDGVQVNSITGGEFDFPRVSLESGTGLEYRPSSHSVRVRAVDCLGSTFHGSNTIVTDYLYVGSSAECVSGASMNVTTRMHMWSGTLGKVGTSSEDRPVITLLEGSNSTLDALPFNQLYFDNIDFVSRGTLYWHYRHIGAYHVYLRYHTTWTNYGELIVGGFVGLRFNSPTELLDFSNFGSMRYDSDMVELHASNDRRVWFRGDCTNNCNPETIHNYGVMDFSEALRFDVDGKRRVFHHDGSVVRLPSSVVASVVHVEAGSTFHMDHSAGSEVIIENLGYLNISQGATVKDLSETKHGLPSVIIDNGGALEYVSPSESEVAIASLYCKGGILISSSHVQISNLTFYGQSSGCLPTTSVNVSDRFSSLVVNNYVYVGVDSSNSQTVLTLEEGCISAVNIYSSYFSIRNIQIVNLGHFTFSRTSSVGDGTLYMRENSAVLNQGTMHVYGSIVFRQTGSTGTRLFQNDGVLKFYLGPESEGSLLSRFYGSCDSNGCSNDDLRVVLGNNSVTDWRAVSFVEFESVSGSWESGASLMTASYPALSMETSRVFIHDGMDVDVVDGNLFSTVSVTSSSEVTGVFLFTTPSLTIYDSIVGGKWVADVAFIRHVYAVARAHIVVKSSLTWMYGDFGTVSTIESDDDLPVLEIGESVVTSVGSQSTTRMRNSRLINHGEFGLDVHGLRLYGRCILENAESGRLIATAHITASDSVSSKRIVNNGQVSHSGSFRLSGYCPSDSCAGDESTDLTLENNNVWDLTSTLSIANYVVIRSGSKSNFVFHVSDASVCIYVYCVFIFVSFLLLSLDSCALWIVVPAVFFRNWRSLTDYSIFDFNSAHRLSYP